MLIFLVTTEDRVTRFNGAQIRERNPKNEVIEICGVLSIDNRPRFYPGTRGFCSYVKTVWARQRETNLRDYGREESATRPRHTAYPVSPCQTTIVFTPTVQNTSGKSAADLYAQKLCIEAVLMYWYEEAKGKKIDR